MAAVVMCLFVILFVKAEAFSPYRSNCFDDNSALPSGNCSTALASGQCSLAYNVSSVARDSCPLTCGYCHKCMDDDLALNNLLPSYINCSAAAAAGECYSDTRVPQICVISCGLCDKSCADDNSFLLSHFFSNCSVLTLGGTCLASNITTLDAVILNYCGSTCRTCVPHLSSTTTTTTSTTTTTLFSNTTTTTTTTASPLTTSTTTTTTTTTTTLFDSLPGTPSPYYGECVDRDDLLVPRGLYGCDLLVMYGFCLDQHFETFDLMVNITREACPKACGRCPVTTTTPYPTTLPPCVNDDDSVMALGLPICGLLANNGSCSSANATLRAITQQYCPLSCQLCDAVCEDYNTPMTENFNMNCIELANAKTCNQTDHAGAIFLSTLMQLNCPVSCGICYPYPAPVTTCADNHAKAVSSFGMNCTAMAKRNMCYHAPPAFHPEGTEYLNNFTFTYCPVSCRYCIPPPTTTTLYVATPPPTCADDDLYMKSYFGTTCAKMAQGKNCFNVGADFLNQVMSERCALSCGFCTVVTTTTTLPTSSTTTTKSTTTTTTSSSSTTSTGAPGSSSSSSSTVLVVVIVVLVVLLLLFAIFFHYCLRKARASAAARKNHLANTEEVMLVNPHARLLSLSDHEFRTASESRLSTPSNTTAPSIPMQLFDLSQGVDPQRSTGLLKNENYHPQKPGYLEVGEETEALYEMPSAFNYASLQSEDSLYAVLKKASFIIPRQRVRLGTLLGAGQFGNVNKGEVLDEKSSATIPVAIKTLRKDCESGDRIKFLQEAVIMSQFSHPNIVRLVGAVTHGDPVMIILELMPLGSLLSWLQANRPAPAAPGQSASTLSSSRTLISMATDVSRAMEYLSSMSFLHRDLAARNCLVGENLTVKVADFGLARDSLYSEYYMSSGGKIALRWAAPESIFFRKFSTASDVWSFGVLMYEIWSFGARPYGKWKNAKVCTEIDNGYRLPPPSDTPPEIYEIMFDCWNPDSHSRPTFQSIRERLEKYHLTTVVEGSKPVSDYQRLADLQRRYIRSNGSFRSQHDPFYQAVGLPPPSGPSTSETKLVSPYQMVNLPSSHIPGQYSSDSDTSSKGQSYTTADPMIVKNSIIASSQNAYQNDTFYEPLTTEDDLEKFGFDSEDSTGDLVPYAALNLHSHYANLGNNPYDAVRQVDFTDHVYESSGNYDDRARLASFSRANPNVIGSAPYIPPPMTLPDHPKESTDFV